MGTTSQGLPYPEDTDPVAQGAANIQALAEAVDDRLVEDAPSQVPTGAVLPFAGSAAPTGWLLADGSLVSRSTYADLFAVLSTTYGAGDGSTTFALPDLRGRAPVGAMGAGSGLTARTLGAKAGAQDATLPSHAHTTGTESANHQHSGTTGGESNDHVHAMGISDAGGLGGGGSLVRKGGVPGDNTGGRSAGHTHAFGTSSENTAHSHTVNASGSSASDANMPPYLALAFIIKA